MVNNSQSIPLFSQIFSKRETIGNGSLEIGKKRVKFPTKRYKNGSCQHLFITTEETTAPATTTATTTPIQQVSQNIINDKVLELK